MSKKYIFREITEKEELEKLFQLRYNIYSNCKLNGFVKNNKHSIDIDPYDLHSRHYSLTCENINVGYLRVVLPKKEIFQEMVLELGRKYNLLNCNTNPEPETAPYPFLSYKVVPHSYWDFYKSISSRNEKIIEASRLVLHPEFRTIRSSKFMIECAMVLYILFFHGMKQAIISCLENHSAFYKHYGFKEIDANDGYQFPEANGSALYLNLLLTSIPQKNHSRFQEMADEYKTTNKIEKAL